MAVEEVKAAATMLLLVAMGVMGVTMAMVAMEGML